MAVVPALVGLAVLTLPGGAVKKGLPGCPVTVSAGLAPLSLPFVLGGPLVSAPLLRFLLPDPAAAGEFPTTARKGKGQRLIVNGSHHLTNFVGKGRITP